MREKLLALAIVLSVTTVSMAVAPYQEPTSKVQDRVAALPIQIEEGAGVIPESFPDIEAPTFKAETHPCVGPHCGGLVTLYTKSGQKYVVAAGAAKQFSGFVSWLESTGYKIEDIGGYAHRRIAGTRSISNHARGTALDINQERRNRVTYRFPPGTTEKAKEFGLLHGAVWDNPDTGHFELLVARQYAVVGGAFKTASRHYRRHSRVRYASRRVVYRQHYAQAMVSPPPSRALQW